jgi:hypothetical protein
MGSQRPPLEPGVASFLASAARQAGLVSAAAHLDNQVIAHISRSKKRLLPQP